MTGHERIKCHHCGNIQYTYTHWVKEPDDKIKCERCGSNLPAHMWSLVDYESREKIPEQVIFD